MRELLKCFEDKYAQPWQAAWLMMAARPLGAGFVLRGEYRREERDMGRFWQMTNSPKSAYLSH
jgi:hypothetical protein